MNNRRIVYQNWIVDLGRDPSARDVFHTGLDQPDSGSEAIAAEVQRALAHLTEEEREFVIRFYYMGESHRQLARKCGRKTYKLESMHKRIMRKLRKLLSPFVLERYGLGLEPESVCLLCQSPDRGEIDKLIATRDRRRTWRPILRRLRQRYGIRIQSPQTLFGHESYHMILNNENRGDTDND